MIGAYRAQCNSFSTHADSSQKRLLSATIYNIYKKSTNHVCVRGGEAQDVSQEAEQMLEI
eukprot:1596727-Amphidinium_carterae.1